MMLPVGESISQLKWLHKQSDTTRSVPRGPLTCYFVLISFRPMHMQSFDDASRGPLGSVAFFWKGRKYGTLGLLTYVGCILTIAAVALDPFAQQVISFPSKQTELDGEALVKRSQVYDYGNKGWRGGSEPGMLNKDYTLHLHVGNFHQLDPLWRQDSNTLVFVIDITRDPLLSQASISGVFDQVYSPPFSCSVTNCTYPEFTTLGVCSRCDDVTSEVTTTCEKFSSGTLLWGSATRCYFATPSGFNLTAFDYLSGPGQSSHTLANTSIADFNRNTSAIMHLALATFNTTAYDAENGFDRNWMDSVRAYECLFSLCANVLSDWAITNGTLRPGNMSTSALTLLSAEEEGYAGHSTFIVPDGDDFPGNRTFVVNFIDQTGLYNALFNVLAPSTSRGGLTSGMTIENALTQVLFTRPDVPATFQNMATGMSNVMMSGPNSELVSGKAYGDEVYIQVNWPWLALSVVLEIIMALFLAGTVYQTHKTGQNAWKSSLLPLIEGHHFGNKSEVTVLREEDPDRDSLEMVEFSNGNDRPPGQATRRVEQ